MAPSQIVEPSARASDCKDFRIGSSFHLQAKENIHQHRDVLYCFCLSFKKDFKINFIFTCRNVFTCVYICVPHARLVPVEFRKGSEVEREG